MLLPERFLVTVYRNGARRYQKLGETIPGALSLMRAPGGADGDALFDAQAAWGHDFRAAVNVGMALALHCPAWHCPVSHRQPADVPVSRRLFLHRIAVRWGGPAAAQHLVGHLGRLARAVPLARCRILTHAGDTVPAQSVRRISDRGGTVRAEQRARWPALPV